jgi:hypothetical protein
VKKRKHNNGGRFRNANNKARNIEAFLAAYERSPLIKAAARAVGITHACHYNWLADEPGYAERFEAAHQRVVDRVGPMAEAEAIKRAIEGVETLVIAEGRPVMVWVDEAGEYVTPPTDPANPGNLKLVLYRESKKSDQLLLFLLRSIYPEKYGDKQKVSLTGANGGPVQSETTHKFDHDRFAEIFRSRFGGDRASDRSSPTNGN